MDETRLDNLVRDLVRLLQDLRELYDEAGAHMAAKLEAIRRGDSEQIHSITSREMLLAGRAVEREGLRRQIVERIGEILGLDAQSVRTMRLSELAEHLGEPRRSRLLTASTGLRAKLEEVERLRGISAMVTTEMLRHLGEVLMVMRSGGREPDVYSRRGRQETPRMANVFEAVG